MGASAIDGTGINGAAIDGTVTDVKPLLRGWLHLVCFFLAIPTSVLVIAVAQSAEARIGAIVYAVGLVALFGVSGFYHRLRWSPRWLARMQRLDHTTIFVMIAGSYTPLCLLVLDGWLAVTMLVTAWGARPQEPCWRGPRAVARGWRAAPSTSCSGGCAPPVPPS